MFVKAQCTAPPVSILNGFDNRGMYVSGGEVLIKEIEATRVAATNTLPYIDMTAGTACLTPKTRDLFDYANANNFNYLILYGLAKKLTDSFGTNYTIAGNVAFNDAISAFLNYAHSNLIKVGAVVTNEDFLLNINSNGSIINSSGVYYFSSSPFYYNFAGDFPCDAPKLAAPSQLTHTIAFRDSGGFGGDDDEIDTSQYIENFYDDALVNPSDTSFRAVQLSEMLKQVYRIAKYSYEINDWYNLIDKTSTTPPLTHYLFDFISIEFEYWNWNGPEFTKYLNIASSTDNAKRLFWDDYTQIVYTVSGVCRHMCWNTRSETELILKESTTTSATDPTLPLPINEQATFISSYLSRALLTSYTNISQYINGLGNAPTTSVLDKTADAITTFAEVYPPQFMFSGVNPNDYNPLGDIFEIWPIFSAQTANEQKHDFGLNNGTYWSSSNYYGPALASGTKMCEIEENYQNAFYGYDGGYTSGAGNFPAIPLYSNNTNHLKTYHYSATNLNSSNSYTLIGGFVWYNYMLLSNPNRTPSNYSRLNYQINEEVKKTSCSLIFMSNEKILQVVQEGTLYNNIEIFDSEGKLIISQSINGNVDFTLNSLSAGFYLSKLNSPTDKPLLKKVIILN